MPECNYCCQPEPRFAQRQANEAGMAKIHVWAETGEEQFVARRIFGKHLSSIEDGPGTSSTCANLSGWMLAVHEPLPVARLIYHGDRVDQPCRLRFSADATGTIFVVARVIELGRRKASI